VTEPEAFWDLYWETRLQSLETLGKRDAILAASRVIRRMAGQLGRPLRLLELGCGEGQILGTLLDAHASVCDVRGSVGVDYQAQSLAYCRRKFPGAHWLEGDFTDPGLVGGLGGFDLVLLVNALHEVFSAATIAGLGEIDVPLGKQRVAQALSLAANGLVTTGSLVLFDGLEPDGDPAQTLRIRFLHPRARAEFERFVREYRPFHAAYRKLDDGFSIELSLHDFIRYIDKSIFIGKGLWETERLESYQYFTEAEFRSAFARAGLELAHLETFTVNEEKWRSRVEILSGATGFPQEHILIVAQKEAGSGQAFHDRVQVVVY
jgi:SAM-dependent methyltransferase